MIPKRPEIVKFPAITPDNFEECLSHTIYNLATIGRYEHEVAKVAVDALSDIISKHEWGNPLDHELRKAAVALSDIRKSGWKS
jgi:hypothetical protein